MSRRKKKRYHKWLKVKNCDFVVCSRCGARWVKVSRKAIRTAHGEWTEDWIFRYPDGTEINSRVKPSCLGAVKGE